jgi:uncharacterized NAD-dependent epimerase/dehydratase family protein
MTGSRYAGSAIVYCNGAFGTPGGKTAHGLVRRSERFRILSVVDEMHSGEDAGAVLDGEACDIPIFSTVREAMEARWLYGTTPTHLVIGLAPDGGRLPPEAMDEVVTAVEHGLSVISGLHDWLSDDARLSALALERGVEIVDIRKPPPRHLWHFFSGKIEDVTALRVAVLGTDSAVGKRTTAWKLVDALEANGLKAELVGTGQTAWLQGAMHCVVMDAIVNDFVSGEIEHAVWSAWKQEQPDVIVVEGQGSLMNPAYPGGFEILAAARPQGVFLQHAPDRMEYDGFPGYPIQPLDMQISAIEIVSGVPVLAVTVNHEGLMPEEVPAACARITRQTGLPALDPLEDDLDPLIEAVESLLRSTVHGTRHRGTGRVPGMMP